MISRINGSLVCQGTDPTSLPFEPIYQWQVRAESGGTDVVSPTPPAPPAQFRVLDSAEAAELAEAETRYDDSHLLMALLYARAGLLDESEEELRALGEQNPQSSVVSDLARSVSGLRER